MGPPEFAKGDGRLRPSLQQRLPAAQRGPRRDAQPLHATPLAAVLFPAPLRAQPYLSFFERLRCEPPLAHISSEAELSARKALLQASVKRPDSGGWHVDLYARIGSETGRAVVPSAPTPFSAKPIPIPKAVTTVVVAAAGSSLTQSA